MLDVLSKKCSIEAEDLLFTPQKNPTMRKNSMIEERVASIN